MRILGGPGVGPPWRSVAALGLRSEPLRAWASARLSHDVRPGHSWPVPWALCRRREPERARANTRINQYAREPERPFSNCQTDLSNGALPPRRKKGFLRVITRILENTDKRSVLQRLKQEIKRKISLNRYAKK